MSQSLAAPSVPIAAPDSRVDVITVAQIRRALLSRWRWVALPTLAALVGSALYVNSVTPRYTAETRILLESGESFYTRPGQDRAQETSQQFDEQAVASQVQVVMSRDLAREAIRRLDLVGNPEFDPMVGGLSPVQRLLVLFGASRNPLDRPPEDRVLDRYLDSLLVYPVGRSRIVAIEFRSKDPELAARAANTVAELYLSTQEAAKKDTARSASTWLGSNIQALRARVTEAEGKVEEFRARSGLLAGASNGTIAGQQLSDMNAQLSQARSAQADSQAKARLIRDMLRGGRTFDIPDVANNELIRRLIEQRINLRAQLALELRTLMPNHPRIKELNAQLSDLEAQIRGAAERTVRTLENDARLAGSRVETLQAAVDAQKKVVAQANENEVQLRALEREAKAQRDQLESYLGRYREATARDADKAMPADARVVSRAIVPMGPSFPKKLPTIAFVTLATLALAIGLVIALELLSDDPRERREEELPAAGSTRVAGETGAGLPPVAASTLAGLPGGLRTPVSPAAAPTLAAAPALLAEAAPHPGRYDFSALVDRLSRGEPQGRGRRVLVTGAAGPADAVELAEGLGRNLARRGRTILVAVDAAPDEKPDRIGFTDLVAGEAGYAEVIERETGSRLHRVHAGFLDGALLASEWSGVDIALSAFDQTYEWVLCLLHGEDETLLAFLAPRVDSVVIGSDAPADDARLVGRYEAARDAGAPDVVVAREGAPERIPEPA